MIVSLTNGRILSGSLENLVRSWLRRVNRERFLEGLIFAMFLTMADHVAQRGIAVAKPDVIPNRARNLALDFWGGPCAELDSSPRSE